MVFRLRRCFWVVACACLVSPPSWADGLPQADALGWLQRIASAARHLNYAGTFVYQQGDAVETSRIVHLVEGNNEMERLESLDGPRREVIRNNEMVYSYQPDSRSFRMDRRKPGRTFPQLLPDQLTAVTDHYVVKKAEVDSGKRAGIPTEMAEKVKALERENRELRQANDILRKASAYFAMAELDRRSK